ncbi:Spx/MgsR family RNA polymerase-binding regulatory protein [Pajaroellobacter abortibovis]|uniref:ArsC family transcriptional regulator n=1 Tax=Pajaroellobacter abortibovis TaxID=1882918 RepID=A0A1L6MZH0_9BACT|nr:Spx/MgsR family RNA polymerase-binding regulatory protein [Pajaroellobacter abortibovis]APS00890.1 ArsC family transcriptional regulator [Pajaroellobacter abortibovis]
MRTLAKEGDTILLAYTACNTCKKALKWLDAHGIHYSVRSIVQTPPTEKELQEWIPASGINIRKWLNITGQSYRALGKEKIDQADDMQLIKWLSSDGKLVKRPVLVQGNKVLVGFQEDDYNVLFFS